jgi:hypothetical protein
MLGLVFKETSNLVAALLGSHTCLTTSRDGIAIPSGGSVDFASFGSVDPTLHLGIESASEPLDETRGNLVPQRSALRT